MQIIISHGSGVKRRELNFEVEVIEPNNPTAATQTLLLIAGMGQQLIAWPDDFVQLLTRKGFRVIRYDHRDVGLSCGFDHLGMPSMLTQGLRYQMGLSLAAPYSLDDMAADAWAILDTLNIDAVHLVGISLGGMQAQIMAAEQPERVKSLSLLMTTSGARGLPGPKWIARKALLSRPLNSSRQAVIDNTVRALKLLASPAFAPSQEDLQKRVRRFHERAYRPSGTGRHLLAGTAGPDRSPLLHKLTMPVVIIHGKQDPLIPLECGADLAKKIPLAQTEFIDGMGHDLPVPLFERITTVISANANRPAMHSENVDAKT